MSQNPDIAKAIKHFKETCPDYEKSDRYYRGDHDLKFATEKFQNVFGPLFREFALNLCPAVVDALRDKLIVTEFGGEAGGDGGELPNEAWRIWQANRMGKRSGEVHKEAVKNGDSFVIVWPDAAGRAAIYPNRAATCMVVYDEETPGKILWAAKHWQRGDGKFRLNLFYPDRVEKYVSKKGGAEKIPAVSMTPSFTTPYDKNFNRNSKPAEIYVLPDAKEFVPLIDEPPVIANPYGVVPVFHFANNSDIGMPGMSELRCAIPVQDALNKSVLDMLVAMEFASYRQRWAAGIEIEYDENGNAVPPFTAGIEKLWVSENPETKFGDFEAANLEQFLKVKDGFRIDMACVTGTPIWYFMQSQGDFPSGEALRKSESRFTNKVRDRQETFGAVWEDAIAFALTIEKKGRPDVRLFAKWEDPSPLSEKEQLENLILKKDIGVTDETLMMEAGYGEAEIAKMLAAKEAERERFARSFNAGETGEEDE